ncbi:diaminopimelate epimerase [Candidatus Poriferisodalis sp.]|uniref:diaminopimelate epimerase n=1 Tax=Candidatus Poriferisodalis sp. TaxID=3101277 RepID=UPI003B59DC14
METLQFTKHDGLGNDFLIALLSNDEKAALDARGLDWAGLAERVCNRHSGIGADGLVLGIGPTWSTPTWYESAVNGSSCPGGSATARMVLYNSDGSRAGMSGNGSACLANAVASAREPWSLRIDDFSEAYLDVELNTDSGTRSVRWRSPCMKSNDGEPVPLDTHIDVIMPTVKAGPKICPALDELISETFGGGARGTGDVGNPHLVIATGRKMDAGETERLGASYQEHFVDGINVEFVWPVNGASPSERGTSSSLGMSVWERGAGLTKACGTGAVVSAIRAREWGLVRDEIFTSVLMTGGLATVAQAGPTDPPVLQVWADHVGDYEWPLRGPWLDS